MALSGKRGSATDMAGKTRIDEDVRRRVWVVVMERVWHSNRLVKRSFTSASASTKLIEKGIQTFTDSGIFSGRADCL